MSNSGAKRLKCDKFWEINLLLKQNITYFIWLPSISHFSWQSGCNQVFAGTALFEHTDTRCLYLSHYHAPTHPLTHSLTHCHIHALKHILTCTHTYRIYHIIYIISFIFILWIRTGLQNPHGYGNSHTHTLSLLHEHTHSHIISHSYSSNTHFFAL
jgi:hypothetical protein